MTVFRRAFITVIRILVAIFVRVKVSGLERVPASGPVLLAINHINSADAFVLRSLMPRDIIGWAKVEIWENPILRPFARALNTIPLRRGELDLRSVRLALQALDEGMVLGLAPEGTRSWHGRLQRGRPGLVFLALRAPGALILPAALYGQERFTQNLLRLRRTQVNVVFGHGFHLRPGDGKVTREMRQEMIDEIMMQIAALLPPGYRSVYSDLSAATERYLQFPPGTESNLQTTLSSEATQLNNRVQDD
jgi:1-acyl-sn-glycerol-3-phosphate acyltransferase